ncbi:GNAT family N-acetyltransferase [Imhoffiella purpurea]|uniref:Histone acetyltransferase HPA2 n=1 Tax=Imhoffiella purpurea TaxID=1249627 RepID=W9UUM1_9GAMM|nr:GNAT family N-acetyltransferase [Imhoffiella purpurea]EXJ10784.1 Histone acetyltransferase HPA2 [Imhoffiella purpurea]
MNIEIVEKVDHLKLIEIWEASVRATHDFLDEDDLQALKPLILEQYFDAVDLICAKNAHGEIQGFCGVHEGNIEMLFISPDVRGKGIGAMLSAYAIKEQGASKVDVNEQNDQALGFYQHIGLALSAFQTVPGLGDSEPENRAGRA